MKKKLAIISLNIPYPLAHGGAVAQYFFLEILSSIYEITFLSECLSLNDENNMKLLCSEFPNVNFLYYKNDEGVLPSKKINYWIELKVQIHKVFKALRLISTKKEETKRYKPNLNVDFGNFIKIQIEKKKIDLVQFEFFETLHYIDYVPKDVFSILIHHEIKFKTISLQNNRDLEFVADIKKYEIGKLKLFSKIAVFNENDKSILCNEGLENIYLSQFGLPLSLQIKRNVSVDYNKFIFLGSENHYPNSEGLKWFIEKIYIPNYDDLVPIYITGNWSGDFKLKFQVFKKIKFTGFVENMEELFENGVLLSPITSGSGVRTKIIQAFANKVPVFSTEIGAEGLLNEDEHIVIFDDKTFMRLYKLHFNHQSLKDIAMKGNAYYNKFFNKDILIQQRISLYTY